MLDVLKQGGIVMYPLGLCSLLTVAILVERLWHFARADRDPETVISRVRAALSGGGNPRPSWADEPAPAVRVVGVALKNLGEPREAVEAHLQAALASENLRLGTQGQIVCPSGFEGGSLQ